MSSSLPLNTSGHQSPADSDESTAPVVVRRQPVRLALLDESDLVRCGLERMLAGRTCSVVLLPPAPPGTTVPPCDLELYDPAYVVPGTGRGIRRQHPLGRVVAFSWDCSPEAVATELARGAAGYISKRAPADRMMGALLQVARGRVVVEIGSTPVPHERTVAWPLTKRETAVLALISRGLSNQEIGEELVLSLNSIKSYIRAAYRKIGVTSRSQAVLWGVRHGLLSWDPDATA